MGFALNFLPTHFFEAPIFHLFRKKKLQLELKGPIGPGSWKLHIVEGMQCDIDLELPFGWTPRTYKLLEQSFCRPRGRLYNRYEEETHIPLGTKSVVLMYVILNIEAVTKYRIPPFRGRIHT